MIWSHHDVTESFGSSAYPPAQYIVSILHLPDITLVPYRVKFSQAILVRFFFQSYETQLTESLSTKLHSPCLAELPFSNGFPLPMAPHAR